VSLKLLHPSDNQPDRIVQLLRLHKFPNHRRAVRDTGIKIYQAVDAGSNRQGKDQRIPSSMPIINLMYSLGRLEAMLSEWAVKYVETNYAGISIPVQNASAAL